MNVRGRAHACAAVLLVLGAPAAALAQSSDAVASAPAPPDAVAQPAPPRAARWYGWQTLLVDAAALGLFVGGYAGDARWVSRAGVGVYVVGPPVVHVAHRRPLWAGVSLGARAASIAALVLWPNVQSIVVTYPAVVAGDAAFGSRERAPQAGRERWVGWSATF